MLETVVNPVERPDHLQLPLRRRVLGTALAAACVPGALWAGLAAARSDVPRVLRVGNPLAPVSLDPALNGNGRVGMYLSPAYEPLVRTMANGRLAPALASAWELSADSTEASFTLRPDARFSDGEPVTAEAARKSIAYWVGKKGPFANNLATLVAIEVLDRYRFKLRMSEPQPNLISLFDAFWLCGDLISPRALENPQQLATQTFGAGPYQLDPVATVHGKSYVYVPNAHYHDSRRIHWDKIIIHVLGDQHMGLQALKSGQISLLSSDPFTAHAEQPDLSPGLRIVSDPTGWLGLLLLDRGGVVQPELKDLRVRQAINHAIDRRLIARKIFGRFAQPTVQLQGQGFMGHDPNLESRYPYDPARARSLLAAAGVRRGFVLKIAFVNNTLSRIALLAISNQLKPVGIEVKRQEIQSIATLKEAALKAKVGALLYNPSYGVPNLAWSQMLGPEGNMNIFQSEDATLARLILDASSQPVARADAAWKKVYARVVDLAWFAPLASTHNVYVASSAIRVPRPGQSMVIDLIDVVPVP